VVVTLLAAAALGASPAASAACTRWASGRGADQARGTAAAPFRTVTRLLRALPRGGTGCLVRGSVFRERVFVRRGLTLESVGGRATIIGGVVVTRRARGAVVRGLAIRGAGRGRAAVLVQAHRARIVGNDIAGRYRDRNVPCILLDGVRGAVVEGNVVHDCTHTQRQDLYSAGIVVASALRARVVHNLVFHTRGDGIALAPNAQRTRVARNIVDGNVSGIYIGGDERTASSHNVVIRNVVSNSGRWNVHSGWSGRTGRANVVTSNCLWNGFGGNLAGTGLTARGNLVARPRFVSRPRDFTMRSGPCMAMHPYIVETRIARLPRFRVAYRLRALPRRVQVVGLTLTGLSPGARMTVRCVRGCRASWHGRARFSTLELPVLRGAWLARGTVLEVRARKPYRAGHYVRVIITGLPRGLRVAHACLPPAGSVPVSCSRYRA
jgi:Right handed beta helix region